MAKKRQAPTRAAGSRREAENGIVAFSFGDSTYQIDVERQKVYRSWVEVERMKQAVIISAFRDAHTVQT